MFLPFSLLFFDKVSNFRNGIVINQRPELKLSVELYGKAFTFLKNKNCKPYQFVRIPLLIHLDLKK